MPNDLAQEPTGDQLAQQLANDQNGLFDLPEGYVAPVPTVVPAGVTVFGITLSPKALAGVAAALLLLIGLIGVLATGGDDGASGTGDTPTASGAGQNGSAGASGAGATGAGASGAGASGAPTAAVAPGTGFDATISKGKVTVSGAVPDQATYEQVLMVAAGNFGAAGELVRELKVATGAAPVDVVNDPVLRLLADPVVQGASANGASITHATGDKVVALSGKVSSQQAKERLVGAAAGIAGGLEKVVDQLQVAEPKSTTTSPAKPSTSTKPGKKGATGATTPPTTEAPATVQENLDQLLTGKVVEFDTGSAALNPQWEATVNEVAQLLVGNTAKLQVAGHTDDVGDAAKNQALSEQRANTIRDALVARGVAADRLTTAGFGPTRPIADNATDEGRQRNRRIEFVVAAR